MTIIPWSSTVDSLYARVLKALRSEGRGIELIEETEEITVGGKTISVPVYAVVANEPEPEA